MENVMTRTIIVGKRIGIVTLAAVGALALPAATTAASASVTRVAAVDCAALHATHDSLEARLATLYDMLAVASPAQKPGIIAQIKRLEAQEAVVDQQLAAGGCH
jgi:hypothetical protein